MHDIVIRGGTVVDGLGGDLREADIAIDGDRIVQVGLHVGPALNTIDARGLIVTPGFVDLHTHYDGQVMWDPILAPSSWHGITTLVTGNCGVGFAPVRADTRAWLIEIMESVEEIPREVLDAGLQWDWESFGDYLDSLARRPHAIDIGAQIPHIALRGYVMEDRAIRDERATDADIDAMNKLIEQGLRAGAVGFSCSRTKSHRFPDGRLVPGSLARRGELLALSEGVRRAGHGPVQFMCDTDDWDDQIRFMTEMSRRSNAPVHFTVTDKNWQTKLAAIEEANKAGVRLVGDVAPRAIGNILQWRSSRHPFMDRPSIRAIAALPWLEQVARLKDPAFRAKVLSESNGSAEELLPEYARAVYRAFDRMYEMEDYPDYEPDPKKDSISARAAAKGQDPAAYAYDAMMRGDGAGMIYMTIANYKAGDFSEIEKLISHEGTVTSLSDGGAHCTRIIDASAPTFMLAHWARDRIRGSKLPLATVVRRLSRDTARAYGFMDRGIVAPGYLADLNVIDFERLRLPAPYMSHDFPTGARRLLQAADGYVATLKRGQVTFREGEHTGALPGQLVRGPQAQAGA